MTRAASRAGENVPDVDAEHEAVGVVQVGYVGVVVDNEGIWWYSIRCIGDQLRRALRERSLMGAMRIDERAWGTNLLPQLRAERAVPAELLAHCLEVPQRPMYMRHALCPRAPKEYEIGDAGARAGRGSHNKVRAQ